MSRSAPTTETAAGSADTASPARCDPSDDGPLPSSRPIEACRVERDGAADWSPEEVVSEFPLTVVVNGEEMATLVCSPSDLEEMVLGFLTAEGVLRRDERITRFFVDLEEGVATVEAPDRADAMEQDMFGMRYVGSCCGKSRTGFYFANDARTARKVESELSLRREDAFRLMEELQEASPLFSRTGGVHNAGLATVEGGVHVVSTDIGRHNTLDKLYGHALREDVPLEERVVVFSGRISSEILLKISKMGSPVLLSKSAPTALALDMADELGITTAGFLRRTKMNVYTHPWRFTDLPEPEDGERDG